MAYLRARRLTEAARRLAGGKDEILRVALDAQYGSHEAFTRAFTACFGTSPSSVRQSRSTRMLTLQEPIEMDKSRLVDLAAPKMTVIPGFSVIGLAAQFTFEYTAAIPALWQMLNKRQDEVQKAPGADAFGVCHAADETGRFRYLAGFEAAKDVDVPRGMERVAVPAGRYAVFLHAGHVAEIGATVYTIWNKALPDLQLEPRQTPDFERYGRRFDPATGRGGVEIWIPVEG
jgi:AraC family transcriptional regulator